MDTKRNKRRQNITQEQIQKIYELYESTMLTQTQIGQKLNIPDYTISRILRDKKRRGLEVNVNQ